MKKEKIKVYDWKQYYKFEENAGSDLFLTEHFDECTAAPDTFVYNIPSRFNYLKGFILASVAKVTLNNGNSVNLIVTDDGFAKLPRTVRLFLLSHEVGHVLNGDLEKETVALKTYSRAFGVLPKMEVEADRYAASVVGLDAAKRSILYLVHKTNLPFSTKVEFMRRYYKLAK